MKSCRYVKYLYPYECEIENLSDPQELQVAIDSHKRDRRQSDTVEFLHQPLTVCRNTLESFTPVTNTITATQGLQILNSPTVALPPGSMSPYSGGFIVTGPGGAHMVTPQISGPPQLVQMTTPHGIPIMVPTLAASAKHDCTLNSADDRDDTSSQASSETSDRELLPPPAKRVALESIAHSIASTGRITPAGFVMAPTRQMVPTSHFGSPVPHILQMGPNSHIPVVMPTTTATNFISRMSPTETQVNNGFIIKEDVCRRSPLENGIGSPHGGTAKRTQVISASHLIQMTTPPHMPLIIPGNATVGGRDRNHVSESSNSISEQHLQQGADAVSRAETPERRPERKHNGGGSQPSSTTAVKIPFANIAIQSGTRSTSTHGNTYELVDSVSKYKCIKICTVGYTLYM